MKILLNAIAPSRWQPRSSFDAAMLARLASSIADRGLLVPITVFATADGYELVAGERRVRAVTAVTCARETQTALAEWIPRVASPDFWADRAAGRWGYGTLLAGQAVPAQVLAAADPAAIHEAVVVEFLDRVDLTPLERATAVARLMEEQSLTQAQAAARLGLSQPAISQMLSLLAAAPAVQDAVISRAISASAAASLTALPAPAQGAVVTHIQRQVAAGEPQAASKRAVRRLARDVRRFLDPDQYRVRSGQVVEPERANQLRLLRHVVARAPDDHIALMVARYASGNSQYLRRPPERWARAEVLRALGELVGQTIDSVDEVWSVIALERGWTCATCQLRALADLRPTPEGLRPYCRRGAQPDQERSTCDRWVGLGDPVVIPLSYGLREHWPADKRRRAESLIYVDDVITYHEEYRHTGRKVAQVRQRRAQQQRHAHYSDMRAWYQLARPPHFLAHDCTRCAHYDPAQTAAADLPPCAYVSEPLHAHYGDGTRAPRYGALVRDDGLVVPRCEMFRCAVIPDLAPAHPGWRFPRRRLVLDLLDQLARTAVRPAMLVFSTLGWLPYDRPRDSAGDPARMITYVRRNWDALGGDDAGATLLRLALEERAAMNIASRPPERGVELSSPGGEHPQLWMPAALADIQYHRRPWGWPEGWPCPWEGER